MNRIDDNALYLFNTGASCYAYHTLGCHAENTEHGKAFRFAVWAPNALEVSVVGSFNNWIKSADKMQKMGDTGVWVATIGIANEGCAYKYAIKTQAGEWLLKADPFAFYSELRPNTASIVWDINDGYVWGDDEHISARLNADVYKQPMSIYEVHLGSWKEGLCYEELAKELVDYVLEMGYTHIEIMPLAEYPLDDSWGYQITGYYSITSRYGTPRHLKTLIDACHRCGISVIMDWVPAHFPKDAHGLARFDGTALFEHPDSRRGEQPQWGTMLFNFEKSEVKSFLMSNAMFLIKEFHIDALRVDAVSCMLYLDYGREGDDYLPMYGGNYNLAAMEFFRELSKAVQREGKGAYLIAEESTAFPKVTAMPESGGLGFNFKWNMGWMNDTLDYAKLDSIYRQYHHDKLTFSLVYAFTERFILPFSHDEVVHMKNSLIGRFPCSHEHKFLQQRQLFMYQYAHPGKKLLFMGGEFGQFAEWNFKKSLDWDLLQYEPHKALHKFVKALNAFYALTPAFWECDDSWLGFEWRVVDDSDHSVLAFSRFDSKGNEYLCIFNFTPVERETYTFTLPNRVRLHMALSSSNRQTTPISSLVRPRYEEIPAQGRKPAQKKIVSVDNEVTVPLSAYEAAYYRVERI